MMTSPSLASPIALGRTAEIYAWQDNQILKLYRDWCPPAWVEYEAKIARVVQDAGLAVPVVGAIVELNGRRGLVYERVQARSMLDTFRSKPWMISRFAREFAELHVATHACTLPDLPSQRESLANRIRETQALPADLKGATLHVLEQLPDGNQLCHGDFHPGNVLMTTRGPLVIDWITATHGNTLADIARTCLLLEMGNPPSMIERALVKILRHRFYASYMQRYAELRPVNRTELEAWRPVIAAARLNENIVGEREFLLAIVSQGLRNVR